MKVEVAMYYLITGYSGLMHVESAMGLRPGVMLDIGLLDVVVYWSLPCS